MSSLKVKGVGSDTGDILSSGTIALCEASARPCCARSLDAYEEFLARLRRRKRKNAHSHSTGKSLLEKDVAIAESITRSSRTGKLVYLGESAQNTHEKSSNRRRCSQRGGASQQEVVGRDRSVGGGDWQAGNKEALNLLVNRSEKSSRAAKRTRNWRTAPEKRCGQRNGHARHGGQNGIEDQLFPLLLEEHRCWRATAPRIRSPIDPQKDRNNPRAFAWLVGRSRSESEAISRWTSCSSTCVGARAGRDQ